MKVLVIEDEGIAAERLIRLLGELENDIEILAHLDSVRSTVEWFKTNQPPELAFFDIQLADGQSFEILQKVDVNFPIIFTTAFDQYAIDAFKVNAIDYLLKPIVPEELSRAIDKFKAQNKVSIPNADALLSLLRNQDKKYKERFVVKVGDHLKTIQTIDSMVIYSRDKATWNHAKSGTNFLLDFTLDQLEDMLDPNHFFRISRKFIVNIEAISDIITFSNSRLKIKVGGFDSEEMIVARERVGEFKAWLDR